MPAFVKEARSSWEYPCRLWSLWDMLGKYALYFFTLGDLLRRLHRQLGLPLPPAFNPPLGFGGLSGLSGLGLLGQITTQNNEAPSPLTPTPNTLTEDERNDISTNLTVIESICRELGMMGIIKDVNRARNDANLLFTDRSKMQFHVEHITARLVDDLDNESFYHVPAGKEKYCRQDNLFGQEIGKKFPKAQADLSNAGTAFAFGLNTASVFHLMRVLEYCVQRIGVRLKVPIDVKNESWAKIVDHINNAIDQMPGGPKANPPVKATDRQKTRRQTMALAATRLDHVRLVWRNDVMHPKETYDEEETLKIINATQAFLESLVKAV
jgi:hypothetical protein